MSDSKTLPYSDIDLNRWREYGHVLTDSLWLIEARDRTGGHRLDYHGNFIPQIATQTYLRYTKEDDVVLDLFLGSGTSAIEAVRLNRRLVGVELKPDLVEYVRAKIPPGLLDDRIHLLQGDSTRAGMATHVRKVLASMGIEHAQLLVLHPPYHDIVPFSDDPADLSNAPTLDNFLDLFETVVRHGFDLLEPGRFAVLIIGDKYTKGELIPLGFYCLERMQRVGFRTKGIVVKNIAGNERGKGRDSNLWRYRALAGGYYIFKHEYVIIFQKPAIRADVHRELLKVKHMPPWGRVQGDEWDQASRFIYSIRTLDALRRETKRVAAESGLPLREFGSYVIRRWYNFHTHQAALDVILAHPRTRPEPDPFHHSVDFYLDGEGFDLKLTGLPRGFDHDLAYAHAHPEELARWLYENQSAQGRFHAANRLFVVLHDATDPGRTWELRRDLARLKRGICAFLDGDKNEGEPHLMHVEFTDREGKCHRPTAGVIFCTRE
ncbi:MAG: DNA methyltransferase [Chloroflexota bacterium]|nr:DNA methyltransferase [Chloroflexota bacterium]